MSPSIAEIVELLNLQPGQTVRQTVNGHTVELRMLPDGTTAPADARGTLDWIRINRITPAPGTPDSTELLREDRQR